MCWGGEGAAAESPGHTERGSRPAGIGDGDGDGGIGRREGSREGSARPPLTPRRCRQRQSGPRRSLLSAAGGAATPRDAAVGAAAPAIGPPPLGAPPLRSPLRSPIGRERCRSLAITNAPVRTRGGGDEGGARHVAGAGPGRALPGFSGGAGKETKENGIERKRAIRSRAVVSSRCTEHLPAVRPTRGAGLPPPFGRGSARREAVPVPRCHGNRDVTGRAEMRRLMRGGSVALYGTLRRHGGGVAGRRGGG